MENYKILTDIYDRYSAWQNMKCQIKVKMLLLYLEIKKNLELLILISEKGLNNIKTDNPGYFEIINNIDISVMEMVVIDNENSSKILKKLRNLEVPVFTENRKQPQQTEVKNVSFVKTLVYLITKIKVLKNLIAIEDKKVLNKIYFRGRLLNIKKRFELVERALRLEEEDLKEILGSK